MCYKNCGFSPHFETVARVSSHSKCKVNSKIMPLIVCLRLSQRYGLLTWTYLKLIAPVSLLFYLTITDDKLLRSYLIFAIAMVFFMVDAAFNIVCLIGCHMKNHKLLRLYNYYLIGILVLIVIATMFYLMRLNKWPLTLGSFLYQVFSVCLTENVIIEIKKEERSKIMKNKQPDRPIIPGILRNGRSKINQPIRCHTQKIRLNQSIEFSYENERLNQPIRSRDIDSEKFKIDSV